MRPRARFGPGFQAGLGSAAVWRNGEQASVSDPVGPSDEVALIPPVSGGSDAIRGTVVDTSALTGVIAFLVLIGANIAEGLGLVGGGTGGGGGRMGDRPGQPAGLPGGATSP